MDSSYLSVCVGGIYEWNSGGHWECFVGFRGLGDVEGGYGLKDGYGMLGGV